MKVRELAKKNRGEGVRYSFKLYPGAQLEMNPFPYCIFFYYYLMNIVVALPAILRHTPPFSAHRRSAQFL